MITGGITYNADMTYTSNSTISGSVAVTLPAACLTSNGVTVTCTQVTQELAAVPAYTSANCVGSGSGCNCTLVMAAQTSTKSGTYTATSAGLLTETPWAEPPTPATTV